MYFQKLFSYDIAWGDSIAFKTDSIAQSDTIGKTFEKKNVQVLKSSIDMKAVSEKSFDHTFCSLWFRRKLPED